MKARRAFQFLTVAIVVDFRSGEGHLKNKWVLLLSNLRGHENVGNCFHTIRFVSIIRGHKAVEPIFSTFSSSFMRVPDRTKNSKIGRANPL